MSQKYTIGAEIALDGEKDFRNAVTNINKELTILRTELKKTSFEYEGNENCIEALTAKQNSYEKQIDQYKKQIDVINKAIEHSSKVWGENSQVVLTWKAKLAQTESGLITAERNLKKISVQLGGQEAEYQSVGNATRIFSSEISAVNDKLSINESELKKLTAQYSENTGSVESLTAKQKVYLESIENQKQKISILNDALRDSEERYGAGSKETLKWHKQLTDTETALIKAEKALDTLNDELNKQDSELDEAEKAVKDYAKSLDNANVSALTFGDLLKSNILGDLITDGFREAGSYVKDFIHNGIELASNLAEVQNVVDVTFGDGAEQIYQWADAAAESFGMSSLAAQEYNGTMGAMLKSMGLTDNAVREMSMDMVGLAGDMASFYNLDVERAFEKIRSGISGETEPLKQLGINMSVANLEAYALSQGIETAYKSMTEAEKATLRYNYLMSVTADAQGDFARTSDSYANQQRILELQTQNLAASFGEKLLPMVNDLTGALNENMPQIGDKIDTVGNIVTGLFNFVIDNHEAVLSVITGIGMALAAQKGAKVVGNITSAVKDFFGAVKSGQGVMSALAASLNTQPWVLAVGAIAAVTAGLVLFESSVDKVGNSIKDVNKDVKELKKNTDESIASTESEIAVFRDKAARYEELREKANRTAGEEERLAQLAQELQKYMPEGTLLINEQTGAYNSLADSVDNVSEAMRRNATIAAYEEEYTELIKQRLEAQKNLEEAQNMNFAQKNKFGLWNVLFGDTEEKAQASLDNIDGKIEELEKSLNGFYEEEAKAKKQIFDFYASGSALDTTGKYYEAQGKLALEANEKAKATRDQDLKDYVAALDEKQDLRRISEEDYYNELYDYLVKHEDRESVEWFNQLSRYEKYIESKNNVSEKSVNAVAKANTAAEKSTQESYDNQLSEAKKYFDEIYSLYKDGEIDRVEYERRVTELNKEYSEQRTDLSAYEFKKNKELLKENLTEITNDYESTLSDIQNKIDSYKSSTMKSFKDILTFDKDDNGKIKGVHAGAEIKEATADAEQYIALLEELRDRGVSDGLIGHLKNMSIEEGMATAEYYSKLTDKQLKGLEKNWNSYEQAMSRLSTEMFSNEIDAATDTYLMRIQEKLDECDGNMKEAGLKIVTSLVSAFKDKDQAQTLLQHLDAVFSSAEESSTGSAFEAGQQYMKSFAKGIESSGALVSDSIKKARENIAIGFSDFEKQFNISTNLVMGCLSMGEKNTSEKSNSGTVINFNQTNNSPQSLDVGTINRQTRQGLQLATIMK